MTYGSIGGHDQLERIRYVLHKVGLSDRRLSRVGHLSGGQRQRVGFARAIVNDPKILICDEPTASLDKENGAAIVRLLVQHANSGGAVICSSHDSYLINNATDVLTMRFGSVVQCDGTS